MQKKHARMKTCKTTKHRCERVCMSAKLQKQRKNANMQKKRARTQTCKKQGADAEQHKECNAARTLQRCKRSLREHKTAKRQKRGDAKAHASLHPLQNALLSLFFLSSLPLPAAHRGSKSANVLSDSGARMSLSRMLTTSANLGRRLRSCCQHCIISW